MVKNIINKINLRQSACSASSASGNINLTQPRLFIYYLLLEEEPENIVSVCINQ